MVFVYLIQILILCIDVNMAWQARRAMNGLAFGWIALLVFLIIRRFDDMNRSPDDTGILLLSSVVVVIATYETYRIYRQRKLYAMWQAQRQTKIEELETTRRESEEVNGPWRA